MGLVKNISDRVAEIDIIGEIGEDWWTGEGNTLDSVKAEISELDVDELIINVSSLGGDVNNGFAIHDHIKNLPFKTTAKITGMTASAGTIVALGADTTEITQNAFFLIHNSLMLTGGNAEDHRASIDTLEKVDNRLVAIYKEKTGKREKTIRDKMAKDEWMSAEEAMEFGLIDKIIKPTQKVAAQITAINNSKLPNIMDAKEKQDGIAQKVLDKVKAWLKEEKEPTKEDIQAKVNDTVKAQIEAFESDEIKAKEEEIDAKQKEVEAKEKELSENKEEVANLTDKIEALEKEVKTLKGKKGAEEKKQDPKEDGTPDGEGNDPHPMNNYLTNLKKRIKS